MTESSRSRLERMHGLLELLAGRFRGYLPWPQELRDSVVRGHEAAIDDTIKKADALMQSETTLRTPEERAAGSAARPQSGEEHTVRPSSTDKTQQSDHWTNEHIEACKRAGWWMQEKSRGLPGYYPSEAMRAFKDGYDAGRSSLSHGGERGSVEALRELVALKDLKEKIEAIGYDKHEPQRNYHAEDLTEEYERRKPLAWQRAREAIAGSIAESAKGTREDGLREAAAYCRDLSDMVYRQGHANNLAAAQEEMARELERRADNAATESNAKEKQ
jgi:hypothetical protein